MPVSSSIRIVLDSFYLVIFYAKEFSTWIWCLLFAVNVTLNLSTIKFFLWFKNLLMRQTKRRTNIIPMLIPIVPTGNTQEKKSYTFFFCNRVNSVCMSPRWSPLQIKVVSMPLVVFSQEQLLQGWKYELWAQIIFQARKKIYIKKASRGKLIRWHQKGLQFTQQFSPFFYCYQFITVESSAIFEWRYDQRSDTSHCKLTRKKNSL